MQAFLSEIITAYVVTPNSGLSVSFFVISGPAVLSGNTLTVTGSGIVKMQASQSGNENYLPASIERSFTVNLPLSVEAGELAEVQAFPNPANDKLTITLPASVKQASLSLINATGHAVLESNTASSRTIQLNISQLPKGLYVLHIAYQQSILTEKIVIY